MNTQQICDLIANYKTGIGISPLASKYQIAVPSVYRILRKHEIALRPPRRKYPIDTAFFDNIDCEKKAYFLGFLYADGFNDESRGITRLQLQERDKQILEDLNILIQPTKPLQFVDNK